MTDSDWLFVHARSDEAKWSPGLRQIFDYRDLGIATATNGQYIAQVIRHNGTDAADPVQAWHVHDVSFQLLYVLKGWARFEYEGQGEHTVRAGDCILQTPVLPHREIESSKDYEVLEIAAPAAFKTRLVPGPE